MKLISDHQVELFEELARIFSEENNQWAQRNLLIREGTAKFADTYEHNDRHLQKKIRKEQSTTSVSIHKQASSLNFVLLKKCFF